MLFIIAKREKDPIGGIAGKVYDPIVYYEWTLHKVAKGEVGEAVARSPREFDSEKEARSHIASAKIALKAARFAKVQGVSP